MYLDHQYQCINVSPLDTAASSHCVCLLYCRGTWEGEGEVETESVKGQKHKRNKWGRYYWEKDNKTSCRSSAFLCEGKSCTSTDKEIGETGQAGRLKEPLWRSAAVESGAHLVNMVAMGDRIHDECVGWLCDQFTLIQPTDEASKTWIQKRANVTARGLNKVLVSHQWTITT